MEGTVADIVLAETYKEEYTSLSYEKRLSFFTSLPPEKQYRVHSEALKRTGFGANLFSLADPAFMEYVPLIKTGTIQTVADLDNRFHKREKERSMGLYKQLASSERGQRSETHYRFLTRQFIDDVPIYRLRGFNARFIRKNKMIHCHVRSLAWHFADRLSSVAIGRVQALIPYSTEVDPNPPPDALKQVEEARAKDPGADPVVLRTHVTGVPEEGQQAALARIQRAKDAVLDFVKIDMFDLIKNAVAELPAGRSIVLKETIDQTAYPGSREPVENQHGPFYQILVGSAADKIRFESFWSDVASQTLADGEAWYDSVWSRLKDRVVAAADEVVMAVE
ncbi:hypothetical protein J8273_0950 [Carpediemonas membranifera]|uniref:Uncharacterized protein n=1 Tax=Carpediemonas membranifera TaxID=201153 RepID=A0A8J6BBR2_9EUKA|nr:hypothetical protein J8273_0950 [Carpediemonas membranifera]|eukprot:KAG9397454.1 hypothetical protein J8273_0950 [Carpediemonas membranifera]